NPKPLRSPPVSYLSRVLPSFPRRRLLPPPHAPPTRTPVHLPPPPAPRLLLRLARHRLAGARRPPWRSAAGSGVRWPAQEARAAAGVRGARVQHAQPPEPRRTPVGAAMRGSEEGDGAAAGAGSTTRPREGAAARAYPWGKGRRSPARLGGDIRGTGETTNALSAVPVSPFSQQTPSTCVGHGYGALGPVGRCPPSRAAPRSAIPGVPWWCSAPGMGPLLRAHRTSGRGRSSGASSRPCTATRRALQLSSGHGPRRTGRSASPDPGAGQQP
ncbi:unnamed protein product, partial [Urochloa humidicola]